MSAQERKERRSNEKKSKKLAIRARIRADRQRRTLFGLLFIFGIIVVAVIGVWYLLQPRSQGHSGILSTDFSLKDLNGNTFRLSDFRGKVVVIDFMATWCGPCRLEMPHYGVVWEQYKDSQRVVLMSIDIDPRESEETLKAFAQEFPYATWIWARDTVNLVEPYEVTAIPKTVIIDQDGYIRFTHTGVTDASTFIQEINQLLS